MSTSLSSTVKGARSRARVTIITSSSRNGRSSFGRRTACRITSDATCLEIHARTSVSGRSVDGTVRLRSSGSSARSGVDRLLEVNSRARRTIATASSVDRDLLWLWARPRPLPLPSPLSVKTWRCHFARCSSCGVSGALRFAAARGGGGGGMSPRRCGKLALAPVSRQW